MIRLPWVSRHALDVAEKYADFCEKGQREAFDLLAVERSRNDALQERLLSLKMTGAVEPPKPIVATPEQIKRMTLQDQGDELRDLIDVKAGGDLRRRSMMLAQLKRDRADGVSDDVIERQIRDGVQSEGVPN